MEVEEAKKRRYVNFTGFPFPLVPLLSRRTTRTELVPGQVWAFEQEQGIGFGLGVVVLTSMTVIKTAPSGRCGCTIPSRPRRSAWSFSKRSAGK